MNNRINANNTVVSLDDLIHQRNNQFIRMGDLDRILNNEILFIYSDIDRMHRTLLICEELTITKYKSVEREYNRKNFTKLKKLDSFGKRFSLYMRIRPYLKSKFYHLKEQVTIDGNALLSLDNDEFAIALYEKVLGRKASEIELGNCKSYLEKYGSKKIDLLNFFVSSREFRKSNLKIKGIFVKSSLRKMVKLIYRIPIMSYFYKMIMSIFTINKKISDLHNENVYLMHKLEDIERELKNKNNII